MLQAPGAAPGNATFNKPWAQLTPGQQAAVIVAVQAAANDRANDVRYGQLPLGALAARKMK